MACSPQRMNAPGFSPSLPQGQSCPAEQLEPSAAGLESGQKTGLRSAFAWLAFFCALAALGCDAPEGAGETERAVQSAQTPKLSEAKRYRVSLRPEQKPVRLRELHAWVARVESLDGSPVRPTRLAVSGGMPQHAHGFETEPRVTRDLGDGEFLIEGVRFHMSGTWQFRLEWVAQAGADVAIFDIEVEP